MGKQILLNPADALLDQLLRQSHSSNRIGQHNPRNTSDSLKLFSLIARTKDRLFGNPCRLLKNSGPDVQQNRATG